MSEALTAVRAGAVVTAAIGLAIAGALAAGATPPAAQRATSDAAACVTAKTGGRLIGLAAPRVRGGKREVLALVADVPAPPAAKPRAATSATPSTASDATPSATPDATPSASSDAGTTPMPTPTPTPTPTTAPPAIAPPDAPPSCAPSAPDDAARQDLPLAVRLVRFVMTNPPHLETLRADLPLDATALEAIDIEGRGDDDLVIGIPAGAAALQPGTNRAWSSALTPWIADASLGWRQRRARSLDDATSDGDAVLVIPAFGALRSFSARAAQPALEHDALPLPRAAKSGPYGLELSSPSIVRIGRRADGHVLFATAPGPVKGQRFSVVLLDPLATGTARAQEVFLRLPTRERLIETQFLFDGEQAWLAVTSRSADALKIFGEKLLRLYRLESERTRGGIAPVIALESGMNLWQSATFALADVTGEGRRDLAVAYWKGLKDDTLTIDVYVRDPEGGFARSPRTTRFDVDAADRSLALFGPDLDGDGHADLVLRQESGALAVYRGLVNADAKRVVETSPSWSFPALGGPGEFSVRVGINMSDEGAEPIQAGDHAGRPAMIDLDGDGDLDLIGVQAAGAPESQIGMCLLGAAASAH